MLRPMVFVFTNSLLLNIDVVSDFMNSVIDIFLNNKPSCILRISIVETHF